MRVALLITLAATAVTLGGCAAHPMMPMRMAQANAGGPAMTCPMAEAGDAAAPAASAPGHGMHGMRGMHGGHGMQGMHGMHGGHGMHGHHAAAPGAPGTPHAGCPAAQAGEHRH